jgi:gluconokinase
MLDKIRLAAAGNPRAGRRPACHASFDARCCRFLQIDYAALEAETLKGGKSDEEMLVWAFAHGREPGEEEIEVWNAFMTKRGWRDGGTERLNERLAEIGLPPGTVETMFESSTWTRDGSVRHDVARPDPMARLTWSSSLHSSSFPRVMPRWSTHLCSRSRRALRHRQVEGHRTGTLID